MENRIDMKIEKNRFLSAFGEEARRKLIALAEEETFEDGDRVFEEGDGSDGVYLVLTGEVELTKKAGWEREAVIARVGAGEYFGEMGVIDDCGRSAGARAAGRTNLAKIPAGPLLDVLRDEPSEASLQILRRLAEYLRATNAHFITEVLRKDRMEMIGEMASGIIHDFKNPMCNILVAAELINEENRGTTASNYCKMIELQVNRMVAMAHELLDYSQGRSDLDKAVVAIEDLFGEIELLNKDYLRKNEIEFALKPVAASVEVDKDRIMRSFQNLLTNAVEAFGAGGGKIVIRAEKPDEKTVEIRVIDNGPGIPEEIQSTLFEPFVTQGKKKGTGLGMVIAKANIEAHGGTITFSSKAGEGTTFIIRLPIAEAIYGEAGKGAGTD